MSSLFSWRRDGDSNPRYGDIRIHDFQSCSFGQLGHLCKSTLDIIYHRLKKIKCFFTLFLVDLKEKENNLSDVLLMAEE